MPCSEAAANTVMAPVVETPVERVLLDDAAGAELLLEPQPATATAASPAAITT